MLTQSQSTPVADTSLYQHVLGSESYGSRSRLTDAPPELRPMIIELVVKETEPVQASTFKPTHFLRRPCQAKLREEQLH